MAPNTTLYKGIGKWCADSQGGYVAAGFGYESNQSLSGPVNCFTYRYAEGELTVLAAGPSGVPARLISIPIANLPEAIDFATRMDTVLPKSVADKVNEPDKKRTNLESIVQAKVFSAAKKARDLVMASYLETPPRDYNDFEAANTIARSVGLPGLVLDHALGELVFDRGGDAVSFKYNPDNGSWMTRSPDGEWPEFHSRTFGEALQKLDAKIPALLPMIAAEGTGQLQPYLASEKLSMKARAASAEIEPYAIALSITGLKGEQGWVEKAKTKSPVTALTKVNQTAAPVANVNTVPEPGRGAPVIRIKVG